MQQNTARRNLDYVSPVVTITGLELDAKVSYMHINIVFAVM